MRARAALVLVATLALCVAAPLVGVFAAGGALGSYLSFPPDASFVAHAAFSWRVFAPLCLVPLGALALYAAALARARPVPAAAARARFPWWGWVGLALIAGGWTLAWSGFVPDAWRRHSFTPLWLGYVLTLNALAWRRSGRALLTHRTRWFLALFPVSAAFWWLFEYLNQFVTNWSYGGLGGAAGWDYFARATLPFATVLPAVASTWAWLRTFARLEAMTLPALRGARALAWFALALGAGALLAIGVWPQALFGFLWLAPLLLLAGLQPLLLGESLFAPLAAGDWRPLLQPALAALVCGFFWEMWNFGSLAQWHYSIPYVQRFHLFAMPLLGYSGYLPFGIECALVMDLVAHIIERRRLWPLLPPPSPGASPPAGGASAERSRGAVRSPFGTTTEIRS